MEPNEYDFAVDTGSVVCAALLKIIEVRYLPALLAVH
jgi:hypothetical protein